MTVVNLDNCKVLFEAIARGDETAFKNLFELFKGKIYAVAFRWTKSKIASEEITQEVFIGIWTSRSQLTAVKDPEAYLYAIAYNKVSRYLKKEANMARILKNWQPRGFSNETEEKILANNSQKFINNAIEQLPPQKKLIYRLSRDYGKSYSEIGKTLHISPHTAKSHFMKAVKFIRNYLKENALIIAWLIIQLLS
jgi:RNA polymerase sigma-70 factor (family 1)